MTEPLAAAIPARVVRVDFGGCTVVTEDGRVLEAIARGKLMGNRKSLGNTLVVGDVAQVVFDRERAVIDAVAPRRNTFSRRAAGDRVEEQVVAVNLDQVVVVAALRDPEFRAGFVDRVLAQADHAGIPARLVLNKCDLGTESEAVALLADYARAGHPGVAVSARTGAEVEHLRHQCRARRSLFVGHSGVGKSTLLNALFPGLELIDTPGVRSFGLWGIGPDDLDQAYPEFRPYLGECRFGDCRHEREPGCALRTAAESGAVAARRFESYLKLREELIAEAPTYGGRGSRRGSDS